MRLHEQEIEIPVPAAAGAAGPAAKALIDHFARAAADLLPPGEAPVRFVVTRSGDDAYHCELGALADLEADAGDACPAPASIFDFVPRAGDRTDRFNAVMLVPTGVGAEIGGHAGDAAPAATLLAAACDRLILHPNVVNASDINELPPNALYVEGSVICRLLMGTLGLRPVRSNRVVMVIDEHAEAEITELTVNSASAARASMGIDCPLVVRMAPSIRMRGEHSSSGRAVGRVDHLERLTDVLLRHRADYDAVALATLIDVPDGIHEAYFQSDGEMVNPWGGVEAMLTHAVSSIFNVPSAHAPMMESTEMLGATFGIVDPRMAAEAVSRCFVHCVLKGLHRSPRLVTDRSAFAQPGVLTAADVSCLVIPDGCLGLPTLAAVAQDIPVIAVRENRNRMRNDLSALPVRRGRFLMAENYLEAAGLMAALRSGVAADAVRRPLEHTRMSVERAPGRAERPAGAAVRSGGSGA
jgi:hypothetical protein